MSATCCDGPCFDLRAPILSEGEHKEHLAGRARGTSTSLLIIDPADRETLSLTSTASQSPAQGLPSGKSFIDRDQTSWCLGFVCAKPVVHHTLQPLPSKLLNLTHTPKIVLTSQAGALQALEMLPEAHLEHQCLLFLPI